MGAQQGGMSDPRQRQIAREGIEMRRNRMRDQAPQAGGTAEEQAPVPKDDSFEKYLAYQQQKETAAEARGFPGMGMDPTRLQMQERSAAGMDQTTPLERQSPQFAPGITFGPGRANRMPDQGSPEYEQLAARMRGLRGRGNRLRGLRGRGNR